MAKRLDLRKDFDEIYAYVVKRVKSFDPETNDGPGDSGPVRFMEFGFSFEQSGWVVLVFDTRPDGQPDGEWNGYIEGNDMQRPKWLAACDTLYEKPLTIILPDGAEQSLAPESHDDLAAMLGNLLKNILLKAKSNGVFAALPKAKRCEIGVEEHEGRYGWPMYEDRGKENLV